jgi:hypothetical protein
MTVASRYTEANETRTRGRVFISSSADVFTFIFGIATQFSVHFVGELYLAEIALMIAFPIFLVLRGRRVMRPELKAVYSLMGLWLLGLIVSDVYNHTETHDRMRGVAIIVFYAINILGLSMLLGGNEKRKVIYAIGLMVGSLATVRLQPSPAFETYPWKFGYAFGTIMLVMLVASYFYARRRFLVSGLLVLGICIVNLLLNYRSPVLDILVSLVLVYPIFPERLGAVQILPRTDVARLVVLAVFALAAGEAAGAMVTFVTRAGLLDADSQAKNEAQSHASNLLQGGRPEFTIGLRAAMDSPIIGHGSWAKDSRYFEMLYDALVESGEQRESSGDIYTGEDEPLIPGHSAIVTAWVWAGITGLIFWLYMAWYFLRGMMRVAILRPPLAPYIMWLLISTWWDIFFSPFAANRRIMGAFMIVFVADLMKKRMPVVQGPWRRLGAVTVRRPDSPGNRAIAAIRPRLESK